MGSDLLSKLIKEPESKLRVVVTNWGRVGVGGLTFLRPNSLV